MKPIIKYTLIGLLVVVAAGITVAGVAYAQGDYPHPMEALAELLGLDIEELRGQLQSGATIQELADEAGVNLDAFREEMNANRQEDMRGRIEEALANGDISQDQADWLLEGLEKGYLNRPFYKPVLGGGQRPGCDREGVPGMRGWKPFQDNQ